MQRFSRLLGRMATAFLCLALGLASSGQATAAPAAKQERMDLPPGVSPVTVARFRVSPPEGDGPLTARFVDRSLGRITSWLWDFGDGTSSTLPEPTHVYAEGGIYSVRLTVSGPTGTDTLEKPDYVIVRRCVAGSVRENGASPLERGQDFVPITGDDGLGFYCVYSGKGVSNGPGISNNVGMFLLPLSNGEVLLFGAGYGDPNALVTPTEDAAYDVRRIDAIIRFCLGRQPASTPIRFVTPHGHIDHINADFMRELRRRGYPIVEIAFHSADSGSIKSLPGWTSADFALFRPMRNSTPQCQEELRSFTSPLGKIWFFLREGHTPGSVDLVIDVGNDPNNRFVVRGSGASFGTCFLSGVREAIDAHGNVMLRAPRPKLFGFGPDSASSLGGTTVVLAGEDFAASLAGPPSVTFDGVPATAVTVLDDSTLSCLAPPGIPGDSVSVRVTNRNGSVTLDGFRYRALPTLAGVLPGHGVMTGSTSVTLTGSGFLDDSPGPTSVSFRGLPATNVQVIDDRTLRCSTPPNSPGLARVVLSNANGSVERLAAYLYDPLIEVDGLTPATGSPRGGVTVQITGSAFAIGQGLPEVFFGNLPATDVMRVSDTQLTCRTPAGTGGAQVDLRVSAENGSDTLASAYRYYFEPEVSAVDPASGPPTAAVLVTVTGKRFTRNDAGPNSVTFGGVPATGVVTLSDTSLQCLAPVGLSGLVRVEVSNANGAGGLDGAYRYHRRPLPLTLEPGSGPRAGGTLVTLRGSGFQETGAGNTQVRFGGALALDLTILDDAMLTCRAPASTSERSVDVVVQNANGIGVLAAGFRYVSRPVLLGIDPARGPAEGGTLVTLRGSGFRASGAGATGVRFGPRAAENVRVLDDQTVTCRTPPRLTGGTVDVRIDNQNGNGVLVGAFRYLELPSLWSVVPDSGAVAGGERVRLLGSGFLAGGTPLVEFGPNAASGVVVLDDAHLECSTPPGVRGPVSVHLRTAGGRARLNSGFVYGSTQTTLTGLGPNHGPSAGGGLVTLQGSNFSGARAGTSTVTFGGLAATDVLPLSDTALSCKAPAGAPGSRVAVQVSNGNGSAFLPAAYRYHLQPSLAGLSPAEGNPLGGTLVTLSGAGFTRDEPGPHTVRFGSAPATELQIVDDTTLLCRAPPGGPDTRVDVELRNANGSARLFAAYQYRAAPALASLAPGSGSPLGGTLVTLTGSGFLAPGAGPVAVRFGADSAPQVTTLNDTTLTCLAPPGAAGASVDVEVSNANGLAVLGSAYRYHTGPLVVSHSPASGSSVGGTTVVLLGSGFQSEVEGPNAVFFGGRPARSVTTVDDTRVRAVSPIGTPGESVDILFSNANGTQLLAQGFRYHRTPTLVAIDPAGGLAVGGERVTIRGGGFQDDAPGPNTVLFGDNAAGSVSVLDDSTLTCTVPTGVAGSTVGVSLTNRNGTTSVPGAFAYYAPPRIDELVPPDGFSGGGTWVEILGAGWLLNGAGANTVRFGANLASDVTVLDDSRLRCRTPAGAAGPVSVQVENALGTAVLANGFYYDWTPTLTSFLPEHGSSLGGTEVAVTGGGFQTAGAGPLVVRFGSSLATNVRVQDGGALLCSAPPGAPGGSVSVVVSNSRGSSSLGGFRYHALPTLTGVDPAVGPPEGGTVVTILGTGFSADQAGTPLVRFAGTSASGVTVLSDTTLRCTAPSGPGRTSAAITLTNSNGSATFVDGFRWMMRAATDLNDDGVGDVLVAGSDALYLFFGSAFGLGDESTASADLVLRASLSGSDFGRVVAAGDLNADQIPDLVVGAPLDDVGGTDTGAVYVFFGPLASSPSPRLSNSANAILRGASPGSEFGSALAIRDLNGDGTNDLAIGARLDPAADDEAGAVYLYRGRPNFSGQTTAQANVRLLGQRRLLFGAALAAGDLTGDGIADLVVGAPGENAAGRDSGATYVFAGGPSLVSTTSASAGIRITGENSDDRLGSSASVADFDGDGTADLFIGAPTSVAGAIRGGLLYAFRGGPGFSSGSAAGAAARFEAESTGDRLGQALALGDTNEDGLADLLVSATQHDVPAGNGGRAYLLLGGPFVGGTIASRADMILLSENSFGDQFGAGLGFSDVDGDGREDLLVGAPFSNGGGLDSGRTYVFFGSALQATRSAGADDVTLTGASASLQLGRALGGN